MISRVIYKYPVPHNAEAINVPSGSKLLKVDVQHGSVVCWVEQPKEYSDGDKGEDIMIVVVPTGGNVPAEKNGLRVEYLNTLITHGGSIILHAYRITFIKEEE